MNTVSKESIAAENLFADVWGNIFSKIYLMSEGQSVEELQKKGDSLLAMMDPDLVSGVLSTGFVPSIWFVWFTDMSDLSQVFKVDDIFTIWLAISGIIRVKRPPVRSAPDSFHLRFRRIRYLIVTITRCMLNFD